MFASMDKDLGVTIYYIPFHSTCLCIELKLFRSFLRFFCRKWTVDFVMAFLRIWISLKVFFSVKLLRTPSHGTLWTEHCDFAECRKWTKIIFHLRKFLNQTMEVFMFYYFHLNNYSEFEYHVARLHDAQFCFVLFFYDKVQKR